MRPEDLARGRLFWRVRDAVIVAEARSQRIVLWNPVATKIFGYSISEALKLRIEALVPDHLKDQHRAGMARYAETGHGPYIDSHVPLELPALRKSGEEIYVELSLSPIETVDEADGDGRFVLAIVRDITERKQSEEKLQRSLDALLTTHEAGQVFGSTLDEDEIGRRLLKMAWRVADLEAAVIHLRYEHQEEGLWHAVGSEARWRPAHDSFEAQAARSEAYMTGEHRLFEPPHPDRGRLVGSCIPLRGRERVIGVLEAYGQENVQEQATIELLGSLVNQASSALENARLYGQLGERERRLQELVGKLMAAQEEERRRVAYEVHDGLAQVAMGAYQQLQAFFHDPYPDSTKARRRLNRALELVEQTTVEAQRVIANLRPTILDDFGLVAAARSQVEELRAEGWEVSYDEVLGEERLPAEIETALYRVAREALWNVRKHAGTTWVGIALERRGEKVRLEVRDFGRGFDPSAVSGGGGPGERVGLSSMRERISLLGGVFEIRSRPGSGTSVVAEVPLPAPDGGDTGHAG